MHNIFRSWILKTALRDGRRGIRALSLSLACIALGVASVVAVASFRNNLTVGIQQQSKALLGADLALESRQPFSQEAEILIRSLAGDQSRQIGFSSMGYFPKSGHSRLVQVRAISGDFPYYGTLETDPPSASRQFRTGRHALVDETLMLQFNTGIGDTIRIGEQDFRIAGKLRKIPGETLAFSLISPRVYIPLAYLDQGQLLGRGSIARYRVFFRLSPEENADRLVQRMSPEFLRLRLEADTVTKRTAALSRSMDNLSRYLHLAVFVAVLLAGVGVASNIHVYAKEKIQPVAILRCIGAQPGEAVVVYVVQALTIAVAGSLLGALLGVSLQALLPLALKEFLPVQAAFSFAPSGILAGIGIGLATTVLFALLPLIPLRKVPPLLALRSSYESGPPPRDPILWLLCFLIAAAMLAFAVAMAERWWHGLWFAGGILGVFGLLSMIAKGISAFVKRVIPDILPYPWRQGLANLHRPNNQTTTVMLAIGLGTFLIVTLYSVQGMLLNEVGSRSGRGEPNLVVFDVQKHQREGIMEILKKFSTTLFDEVPIVTMRLASVKGKRVEELRAEPASRIPLWALRREYRSTYRGRLAGTEQLIEGTWHGDSSNASEPVPVSLEKGIAETLNVAIGDELQFELQGVSLRTRVASVRQVDWHRVQPNFFVVFPPGVLEDAPQFYAVAARAESRLLSAGAQRSIVETFPNVSVIDLSLVLSTLDSILSRVSAAIWFVALFTILTGIAVLASAVLSSRSQRLKESILMRTLGAPRAQIVKTIVAEYLFLGLISATTGVLLAIAASWGLTFYFIGTAPLTSIVPLLATLFLATAVTIAAGVLSSWGIFRRSPLEALRAEG